MKKVLFIFVFSFISISIYAQPSENTLRKTHGVLAPDGSMAMTITDDYKEDTIALKSVLHFYKYQLLDTRTSEPILTSLNTGKTCIFDKSKITAGNYKLRVYTKNFIITSKIEINTLSWLEKSNTILAAVND